MPDPNPADDLVARLWRAYKADGAPDARERLILHYSPLVKFVAGRVGAGLPQSVEQADLVSDGIFGLVDAIEKFEPERGFKFETYAMLRIRGAIIDALRARDWVPRSVRARARQIEQAYAALEHRLQRAPTDAEVADELGLSVEEFDAVLAQVSVTGVVALDETVGGGDRADRGDATVADTVVDDTFDPAGVLDGRETRRILAATIEGMPERERTVLSLYYYEGMTLAEIGGVLGVTESRVCQIHAKAILQLRSRFTDATT